MSPAPTGGTTLDVSSDWLSRNGNGANGRTRMWRFRRVVNRYVNPVTRPVAKRLPTFAILTHRGRKTGRTYRTPINVFRRGNDYYFFLTYGSDVEWVKNVLATGSCSIESRGRVVELVEPELVTDPELRPAPPHVRFVERRIAGVTQYLRMRPSSST
jgi:deazaflavin-dependent oxidoreductase (nitroreductase family)